MDIWAWLRVVNIVVSFVLVVMNVIRWKEWYASTPRARFQMAGLVVLVIAGFYGSLGLFLKQAVGGPWIAISTLGLLWCTVSVMLPRPPGLRITDPAHRYDEESDDVWTGARE